jgi:IS1 family transposase
MKLAGYCDVLIKWFIIYVWFDRDNNFKIDCSTYNINLFYGFRTYTIECYNIAVNIMLFSLQRRGVYVCEVVKVLETNFKVKVEKIG